MSGWIAKARCTEIRVPMPEKLRMPYAVAERREKFRIASENPDKRAVVHRLIKNHPDDRILVIGMYVSQLKEIAASLDAPLLTGSAPARNSGTGSSRNSRPAAFCGRSRTSTRPTSIR